MSYPNIPRKCSVCQCCGACDYEYEIENNCISGDYNPAFAGLMFRDADYVERRDMLKNLFKDKED